MNVIIFHGTDEKPENYWYSWLKKELITRGLSVEVPYYPELNKSSLSDFLPKVLNSHKFNNQTILIGHSAGAPLILSILQNVDTEINKAILVAGFSEPYSELKDPILQDKYEWDKIKGHAKEFIFINSDDDPWGCDDKQGRKMFNKLGGTQIIRHDGHFGSGVNNQEYAKFPLLKNLVLESIE
jgi:predicted alpha/beta hydrolase family esterase